MRWGFVSRGRCGGSRAQGLWGRDNNGRATPQPVVGVC